MQVLQLLLQSTEGEDECRQVVAECLGHTALLHADKVLPVLLQQAQVGATRASAVAVDMHLATLRPLKLQAGQPGLVLASVFARTARVQRTRCCQCCCSRPVKAGGTAGTWCSQVSRVFETSEAAC